MTMLKKVVYIVLGGMIALGVVFGGAAILAQTGDEATAPVEPESADPGDPVVPFLERAHRGNRDFAGPAIDKVEALAEALGITVDELRAAHEAAREALIEQAVIDGLLTREQADALLERSGRFHARGLPGGNMEEALADALGISVDELQAAREAVFAAELAARVEAGQMTQEQADLIAARRAVQNLVDREAISAAIQSAYEAAIDEALSTGAITAEQAETLRSNLSDGLGGFGPRRGPGAGGHGFGGRGHRGGPGFPGGPGPFGSPAGNSPNA